MEKIEVHVHVHRDSEAARSRKKRPAPRPVLTGVLFDRQGHYDKIFKNPPKAVLKRWSRLARCKNCEAIFPSKANKCPRCAAPRPTRILPKLSALIGLGAIVAVFALCAHLLGGSVPEQNAPAPLRQWSGDDYVIVEMPPTPSPFATTYSAPPSPYSGTPR